MADELADCPVDAVAKQAKVDERSAARRARRVERRCHRKCFWTRPFGHKWETVSPTAIFPAKRCVGCGWEKSNW